MSSAAECRPFCLRANEIRYQYVYHRQKLGIYIYIHIHTYIYIYIYIHIYIHIYTHIHIYIYSFECIHLNRGGGGGGAVTMTIPRNHRLFSQRHGATSDHKVVSPTALPRSVQYIGATLITVRQYIYGMNMSALATIWLRIKIRAANVLFLCLWGACSIHVHRSIEKNVGRM